MIWTSQYDLGCTTGWLERVVLVHTHYTVATPKFFDNFYFTIPIYDRKDFEKFPPLTISDFLLNKLRLGG